MVLVLPCDALEDVVGGEIELFTFKTGVVTAFRCWWLLLLLIVL